MIQHDCRRQIIRADLLTSVCSRFKKGGNKTIDHIYIHEYWPLFHCCQDSESFFSSASSSFATWASGISDTSVSSYKNVSRFTPIIYFSLRVLITLHLENAYCRTHEAENFHWPKLWYRGGPEKALSNTRFTPSKFCRRSAKKVHFATKWDSTFRDIFLLQTCDPFDILNRPGKFDEYMNLPHFITSSTLSSARNCIYLRSCLLEKIVTHNTYNSFFQCAKQKSKDILKSWKDR